MYLLCGSETFLRRAALDRVIASAMRGQSDPIGHSTFDGDRAVLADVLDEVRTPSLLGDRRLAVVDDADGFISKHRKQLEKYIADPCDTGTLVLLCDSESASTKLYKAIAALGGVEVCKIPVDPKNYRERAAWVQNWLADRAVQGHGKRLATGVARKLQEYAGESLALLDQELGKLATYVADRPTITAQDVEDLVGNNREQNVFGVTDAMAAGDAARALRHWERVLATDRAAPHRAVGGLAWGIRRRLEGGPNRLLEDQLCDLLLTDVGSKSGLTEVDRAVEGFIVKHTLAAKGSAAGG
jgi:DNA polymerase-3 subunit delta